MSKELYNSGEMSVGGNRGQGIVRRTRTGIAVEYRSLYTDFKEHIAYYKQYPELPEDWSKEINEYGTTEAQYFFEQLNGYEPYRTVYLK